MNDTLSREDKLFKTDIFIVFLSIFAFFPSRVSRVLYAAPRACLRSSENAKKYRLFYTLLLDFKVIYGRSLVE